MSTNDQVRAELIRQRGFIRAADTQGTKLLALLDAAPLPAPVEPTPDPDPEPVEDIDPEPLPEPEEPDVDPAPAPVPLPVPTADVVSFPSTEVAFIAGPQLMVGSELNPWPWHDVTMAERAPVHAAKVLSAEAFTNAIAGYTYYYDLGLSLYILYYRTGDEQYRTMARAVVDRFYDEKLPADFSYAPRSVALGGVLLRALDGRPEMFEYAVGWSRRMDRSWLNRFYETDHTHAGIRDGGFTLLYLAQIAAVHPDPAIRAEFLERALLGAQWFTRTQAADGAWYYNVESTATTGERVTQPFQIGFLLEALIAAHQLTGDESVAASILEATDWLYGTGFYPDYPWESMYYAVSENPASRDAAPGPPEKANATWGYRQNNAPVIHAFGYAYLLTGDEKYKGQGDHLFEATFGYDPEDVRRSTGLAFDTGKSFNQNYRASGRYLAWRLGRR